jgi:hypothetical protein
MRPLAEMGAPLPLIQAQRLLAALVFAAPRPSIAQLAERFLRPTRAEYKERIA